MEPSIENETLQTDKTAADSKESYEAKGARPKQPPAKKCSILFIESFRPDVREAAYLEISEQNGLIFTGYFRAQIEVNDVRIASKYKYETDKECIHLSFYNNDADCISSIFFEAVDTSDTDEYLGLLHNFLKKRLEPHCSSEQLLDHAMNVFRKQPVFIGWVRTTVQEKKEGDTVKLEAPPSDAAEYLVIVDLESVSWYSSKMVKPVYQLTFWAEARPQSIETVKHHHSESFIMFESSQVALIMEAKQDIVRNMRILRPKKINFMKDIKEFLEFVPQVQPDSPFYMRREELGAYDESVSEPAVSAGPSYVSDWTPPPTSGIASLRGELESALEQFRGNEDFQNIWITQEYDLQELVHDGKVPVTDAKSGGLDPNNQDHFKKALMDITDYFVSGEFPTAMSRVIAVREVFMESANAEIQQFLNDLSDFELLKRLYFKSLVQ